MLNDFRALLARRLISANTVLDTSQRKQYSRPQQQRGARLVFLHLMLCLRRIARG